MILLYFGVLLVIVLAAAGPLTRWLGPSTERTARTPI